MVVCPYDGCSFSSTEQGLSVHIGKIHKTEEDRGEYQCSQCGRYFDQLNSHWARSDCTHPPLSDQQKDIAIGMVLGDGYIDHTNDKANPRLQTGMVNGSFVKWLSDKFGQFSASVRRENRENYSANKPNTEHYDYDDVFRWATNRHPWFNELKSWYGGGEKTFPEVIDLTPTITKVWYCCDGALQSNHSVRIYTHNENSRIDTLCDWFSEIGFNALSKDGYIDFRTAESEQLLEWMGSPPDGFSYKWDHINVREFERRGGETA